MNDVFYDIAEQSPETIVAMFEMETGLYDDLASYDDGTGGMSALDLMNELRGEDYWDTYISKNS